ncbi:MAG: caspase family protein [Pyrinomonadaceae bacterium]
MITRFCTSKLILPFLFLLVLPISFLAQNVSSRAPFVLEMPEISAKRYTSPVVRLPLKDISTLKFRVLEPFAADITYGNIIVTLNGAGINRGCDKTRDIEGKVVVCGKREDRMGGYELISGKNIIEIKATDKKEREFYASYVLILGDKTAAVEKPDWTNGAAEKFNGRKFAVIIGVSDYKFQDAGLKNLSYADDDAQAIASFLQTPAGGGFSSADIKLLLNQDASLAAVRSALNDTFKRAKSNDLIFVFIAGHGAPDPLASQNLYFLLTDTKVVDMARTAFPMNELKQMLDTQVTAQRVFVMIDTCHSAGVNQKTKSIVTGRQLEQEGDENNISNFFLTNQLFKQTGRAILTSSDVNEVSQESAKWGNHGVFTWALLDGLKGKADLNGDKLITAGELFQYTRANVQKATNFQQNPLALPGSSKDLTLAFTTTK